MLCETKIITNIVFSKIKKQTFLECKFKKKPTGLA